MRTVLENATLVQLNPPTVVCGTLVVDGNTISNVQAGDAVTPIAGDEVINCRGGILMPGMVVGHTHLYSALAIGMPPPKHAPGNFVEILEEIWWQIDRALDDESIYMSALVGAARAALCGSTTLLDHHASPNAIPGSLDRVQKAMELVGLRGVLCYEVTDRNGIDGRKQGLAENARFLEKTRAGGMFAGTVGAHASFTLEDESLDALAEIADEYGTGVHIHVAEDKADVEDCLKRTGKGLVDRLEEHRILRQDTILGHCTHLSPAEIERVQAADAWTLHNTRSNMNNRVGYAPIESMAKGKLALGTDGIDGDMFAESKAAWFKACDARATLPFGAPAQWLANSAELAGKCLKTKMGVLEKGGAADLVLLDYPQLTPLTSDNLLGHLFFGITAAHVNSVMVNGKWIVLERAFTNPFVEEELARAPDVAKRVWHRL